MSDVVNRRDGLIADLMRMMAQGSSNDVKIVLEDGEIYANKDVLSARCEYFATCFSNNEFVEGESKTVNFNHCNKLIMEKIIQYLFSGDMKLHDIPLADLLKMMNMTQMLLIDDLFGDIQRFVNNYIQDSGVNSGSLPELINGLILAEQFKLEDIKDELVLELFRSLKDVPHIPEVVLNSEAFKTLPDNLLKDILLYDITDLVLSGDIGVPNTKERFDAFVFWMTGNECSIDNKRLITDSFGFDYFTLEELLTDVRTSKLYSIQRIDARVLEIHQRCQRDLECKVKTIRTMETTLNQLRNKLKEKDCEIAQKKSLLHSRDELIKEKSRILAEKEKVINTKDKSLSFIFISLFIEFSLELS